MIPDSVWSFMFWLYVAATLVQLALWWWIFRRLGIGYRVLVISRAQCPVSNTQHPTSNTQHPTPDTQYPIPNTQYPITIIICARNEAENLRRYLPTVLAQEYPGDWEVIVVDDASEDETPAVLQFFLEKNPRLRVVRVFEKKHLGKKHALAQGIAAAKFDNLLLTDADCEPASPHWLAHMAAALAEKPETEIVLGYGPVCPPKEQRRVRVNPTPSPSPEKEGRRDIVAAHSTSPLLFGGGVGGGVESWSRFETAHTAIQYLSFALTGMPYMGVGRNLAFKKQVYERVGGFAAHLDLPSGDDDLLVNAAAHSKNVAICLHPESFVFSESKKTWREWARQKHRHLTAGQRYCRAHQAILTLVSASHVLHYFLFAVLLVGSGMVSVVLLFFLRSLSVLFLYWKILPKLRESNLLSRVPIYDALLAAYYGALVPLSLIVRRRTRIWK